MASRTVRLIIIVPFAMALIGAAAVPSRDLFAILANEDGVAEWSQFILLGAMVALYVHIAGLPWRSDRRSAPRRSALPILRWSGWRSAARSLEGFMLVAPMVLVQPSPSGLSIGSSGSRSCLMSAGGRRSAPSSRS